MATAASHPTSSRRLTATARDSLFCWTTARATRQSPAVAEPSERLTQKVREEFPDDSADEVLQRLREITDPFGREVSERVQAAVVKASAGDWSEIAKNADLAELDWRDVLVAADLATEDWATRLDEYLARP